MCGVVGFLTGFNNGFSIKEVDAFRDMLFLDTMRGWDSTGVFGVDKWGNVSIKKAAMHAPNFIKTKDFDDFCYEAKKNGVFLVGHNRAATKGKISDENAHPFHVDDKIVLVQNGTMRGDHKKIKDVEVDTHAIAHALAEDDDIEKVLQKINASFALAWYHTKEKKLRVLRNEERPLHIARTTMDGVMFASEMETILYAASRNNISLKEAPYLIKAHSLCEYTLDGNGSWDSEFKDIDVKYRWENSGNGDSFCRGSYENTWMGRLREVSGRHPYACGYDDCNDFDDYDTGSGSSQQPDSPSSIKVSFSEYISKNVSEAWMTENEAGAALQYLMDKRGTGQRQVVEICDYFPANNNANCKTWFVYGTIVDPNVSETTPPPLVYWMKHDYDKDQIGVYTAHGFFSILISPPQTISFLTPQNNKLYAAFAYAAESVPAVLNDKTSH